MSAIRKFYKNWRSRWGKVPTALTLTLAILLSVVAVAIAAEFVVTPADPNHLINGAWFMQFLPEDATGTGTFNPFVRLSGKEVVQGYNTDYRPLEFDESASWTDSIPLSDVPYFFYEGTLYREFQLDINQGNPTIISLDEVQIWLGGADAATITGFVEEVVETDFGTFPGYTLQEVYNLDANENNDLILDYSYAAGSGKRDLRLLVPDDYFKPYDEACEYMGTGCEQYMVFFTQFGINEPNNDGFEEWGVAIYNSVSGYKWHDMNANGLWDAGEPGLEDWEICAQEVDGTEDVGDPICTMTDEMGKYIIPLIDGDYRIYETCPSAINPWYQSYPTETGGVCGGGTHLIQVSGGEIVVGVLFGNYQGIPDIDIDKTGDMLSKIGDDVAYTITVDNTSTEGTPDLYCRIIDTMLGVDEYVTLAWDAADHTINKTYTVPEGATDPLINTASVSCTFVGDTTVQASDTDDHSVNLFQPSIELSKTGDTLSKIGDKVDYTITLDNTSSDDTPDLECTITDKMLDLSESFTIAWDDPDKVITVTEFEIPADASDPFENTAEVSCSPVGFTNIIEDEAKHPINLFQPSIELSKTGDTLSKIGDKVDYTITLDNKSSDDTPDLECTITDKMLDLSESFTIAWDDPDKVITVIDFEIPADAADPFENTAEVSCSPIGFPNIIEDEAKHPVNLFQPSFTFTKKATEDYSKAGDVIHYTITLDNTSSADTPDLECMIADSMLGIDETVTLAYDAANHVINETYTVQEGDPDPLVNTATVSCSPVGFENVLPGSASDSVELLHPSFTLSKTCKDEPVIPGEDATFQVKFSNTGDVPLVVTFDEDLTGTGCPLADAPVTVANGTSLTCTVDVPSDTDPGPSVVSNTINAHVTLPTMYGLDNYWDPQASDTCDIYGVKSGTKWEDINADGMWNEMTEPVLSNWKIHLIKMVSPYNTVEVFTGADGTYEFDMVMPGVTYAVCEVLDAGYMQTYPDVTLPAEGYVDCTQFGSEYGPVGYEIMLASGEYEFDNDFGNFKPLGCTYTQGYWKTHSKYGPAGPYDPTWDLKDGGDAPFLNSSWYVGYSWYEMFNTPPKGGNAYILLAQQYMAAWLNIHNVDPMKIANPTVLGTTMADAEYLLGMYTPEYDFKGDPDGVRQEFIMLAEYLDDFNNGLLGVPHCE